MIPINTLAIWFLVGFIVNTILTYFGIRVLKSMGIVQPGKVELETILQTYQQTRGRAIMGGLLIFLTFFGVGIVTKVVFSNSTAITLVLILLGALLLGIVEDLKDINAKKRRRRLYTSYNTLIHGSFTRFLVYYYLTWPARLFRKVTYILGSFSTSFTPSMRIFLQLIFAVAIVYVLHVQGLIPVNQTILFIPVPLLILYAFYVFIIVAYINAFNIVDGIDGISGFNYLVVFSFLFFLLPPDVKLQVYPILFVLLGGVAGFLIFNVPNAKIELSDSGTIPFGTLYAVLSILSGREILGAIIASWFVITVASSLGQVLAVKLFRRRILPIAPLHHSLEYWGLKRESIVMYSVLLSLVMGMVAMSLG